MGKSLVKILMSNLYFQDLHGGSLKINPVQSTILWNIKCSAGASRLVVIHPSHWLTPLVHRDQIIRHLDWNCRLTINSRWTTSYAEHFILWRFLYSVLAIPEPVYSIYILSSLTNWKLTLVFGANYFWFWFRFLPYPP